MSEPDYERIYLQPHAEGDGEHTWCQERIEFDDIEYVRKDIFERAITAAVAAEREACAALASNRWEQWGHKSMDHLWKVDVASCNDIAQAIRNRVPSC